MMEREEKIEIHDNDEKKNEISCVDDNKHDDNYDDVT